LRAVLTVLPSGATAVSSFEGFKVERMEIVSFPTQEVLARD
jgi:hypothetical protein